MPRTVLRERLKSQFRSVSERAVALEKLAKDRAGALEQRARAIEERAKEVPVQLRGAWSKVLEQLRVALDVATREDLQQLSARLDALASQVNQLEDARSPAASAKKKKK